VVIFTVEFRFIFEWGETQFSSSIAAPIQPPASGFAGRQLAC